MFFSYKRFGRSNGIHTSEDVFFKLQQIDCIQQEFFAEIHSNGEVDCVEVPLLSFLPEHRGRAERDEVVQDGFCEDFLIQEICFFRMGIKQADGMFKSAERGFDSPAQRIKLFNERQRECDRVKIGKNSFAFSFCDGETDNTERQMKILAFVFLRSC